MFKSIFNDINLKMESNLITIDVTPTVDVAEIIAKEFFGL